MELFTTYWNALVCQKPCVLYERGLCNPTNVFDYASSKPAIDGTLFWDYGYDV